MNRQVRPWPIVLPVLVTGLLSHATFAAAPLRVTYPRPESGQDMRQHYPLQVLRLALDHSGVAYRMRPSGATMQQGRSLRLLASGQRLDIAWTVPTPARERGLRPITIPIDRGLVGWRVLLIHRGDAARFVAITTPPQPATLRAAQAHDWPDLAGRQRIDLANPELPADAPLARADLWFVPGDPP